MDLGSEQRQICAGIRNHYTPEELVGKQVVVVANLETAKLRGLESQGLRLAASDDGRVIILTPAKPVLAGARRTQRQFVEREHAEPACFDRRNA